MSRLWGYSCQQKKPKSQYFSPKITIPFFPHPTNTSRVYFYPSPKKQHLSELIQWASVSLELTNRILSTTLKNNPLGPSHHFQTQQHSLLPLEACHKGQETHKKNRTLNVKWTAGDNDQAITSLVSQSNSLSLVRTISPQCFEAVTKFKTAGAIYVL